MCGRGIKFLFCFVLVFAFAGSAQAKRQTFHSKSGVGLSFRGGIAANPENETLNTPTTSARSFTTIAAFEPFLDFGKYGLRLSIAGNFAPDTSASGTDPADSRNFGESSEVTVLTYGGSLMLYPYYTEEKRGRAYFGMGGGLANLYLQNTRTYTDGAGNQTDQFVMKGRGSTTYIQGFLGYEFFLVQNYTMSLEAGYRSLSFGEIEHKTSNDARGTTVDLGTPVRNVNGSIAGLSLTGAYGMLSFAIQF